MSDILVIDDQPFIGELLTDELAEEGHHITCVGDADYVMSFVKDSRPDLILLDLYLQGFEGWGVLESIKRYDPSVPVLILTAYDTFKDDPRTKQADGYVIKSFDTGELKAKINEKLAVSRWGQNI